MRIYAPSYLSGQTMYAILGQVFDEVGLARSNHFIFHFEETNEIDAAGLIMMDTLLLRLRTNGFATQIIEEKRSLSELEHLANLQKDSASTDLPDEELIEANQCDLPLHRVKVTGGKVWVQKVFNNWLAHQFYVSSLLVAPQTNCLQAVFDNARKHTDVAYVTAIASYDSDIEEVRVILSDAGIGIPSTIRTAWQGAISDEVAIAKAIEGGSLTKPELEDAKHFRKETGLGRLIREIVDRQLGSVIVTSEFGRLSCFPSPVGKVHMFEPANAYYPGTMVEITFSTEAMQTATTLNEPAHIPTFSLK